MLKAKSLMTLAAVTGASLLAACTTTGNVERNAAGGAALGALAGAVIGRGRGSSRRRLRARTSPSRSISNRTAPR